MTTKCKPRKCKSVGITNVIYELTFVYILKKLIEIKATSTFQASKWQTKASLRQLKSIFDKKFNGPWKIYRPY